MAVLWSSHYRKCTCKRPDDNQPADGMSDDDGTVNIMKGRVVLTETAISHSAGLSLVASFLAVGVDN